MFGLKTISEKRYDEMQAELKGFYAAREGENARNEYMQLLKSELQHQLTIFRPGEMDREAIKNAYEKIAPVGGVVNYIADNVGEVFKYLELYKDGEYIEKGDKDHGWIYDLLTRPNDRYNGRRFGRAWAINKCLFGDAFVYAPKAVGKDYGRVKEMYVLPGHRIQIEKGGLIAPLKGVTLSGNSKTIDLEDKVFQSFDYNLDETEFYGTSKIVMAAAYLDMMRNGIDRENTTIINGGPSHLVTPKPDMNGMMPATAKNLTEELNGKEVKGQVKALKMPVDVHTLGGSASDLSILDSHKAAVEALCFVFKIPTDLYYGQAKYENAKEAKKTIYEQCAIPMANEFAEDLLSFLELDTEGFELKVNTDKIDVLKASSGEVLDNLAKMHASLNELREAYDYDPIEEDYANKPMIPLGIQFGNDEALYDINENG